MRLASRITRVGVVLACFLLASPSGLAVADIDDVLKKARALADKTEAAAAKLVRSHRALVLGGRDAEAAAVLEEWDSLLEPIEETCERLKARRADLGAKALAHHGRGEIPEFHAALAREKRVAALVWDLRSLLSDLWRSRAEALASGPWPRLPVTDWLRSGVRRRWFGPRSRPGPVSLAVARSLDWLARHQREDGQWRCDEFAHRCRGRACGGPGEARFDQGVTALAILAFLASGQTHAVGRHRRTVARGLQGLRLGQDPYGNFSSPSAQPFTYNHACATLAMAEAYGMTGSPLFKTCAQSGLDFIEHCRNPYLVWRYGVRPQDNDTSVTGWMISALFAGKAAGLRVPKKAFEGARNWLEKVTEPEYGKADYTARGTGPARPQDIMDRFPPDRSEALTAAGITMRVMLGEDPESSEMIQKGAALCLRTLPEWNESRGTIDFSYWYHGSVALRQVGGDSWRRWKAALLATLPPHQNSADCQRGSWDPIGPWGRNGGRVFSTAMGALALQAEGRYGRLFGED